MWMKKHLNKKRIAFALALFLLIMLYYGENILLLLGIIQQDTVNPDLLKVYSPIQTNRYGNMLYAYVFWRLLSIQDGKPFVNTDTKFLYPFEFLNNQHIPASAPLDIGFTFEDRNIKKFPTMFDFKYFKGKRKFIQDNLFNELPPFKVVYDVVVHVRLDDVFNAHPLYTLLPFSFYRAVAKRIPKDAKILILGLPIEPLQDKILSDIHNLFKKEMNYTTVVVRNDGTIEEDVISIMSCKVLVASVSSFWVWPAYISKNVKELHLPLFGQNYLVNYDHPKADDYLVVPYRMNLTKKITKEEAMRGVYFH